MKLSRFALLVASVFFAAQSVSAQTNTNDGGAETAANTTLWETTLFLRTSAARNVQFFNYTEAAVDNGRWVVLDAGWLNFGQAGYAEVFVGAGRIHSIGKRGTLIGEPWDTCLDKTHKLRICQQSGAFPLSLDIGVRHRN